MSPPYASLAFRIMSNGMFPDAAHECFYMLSFCNICFPHWKFSSMQFYMPLFCLLQLALCMCVCVVFFFKSFWKKPAGWSCRHRVGALFSSFFSRKMNSGVRCSGKQDFCKSWACFLAVSGVLIGWVNSFVVQLNHCIVDEVYHTLGNGREYTRS